MHTPGLPYARLLLSLLVTAPVVSWRTPATAADTPDLPDAGPAAEIAPGEPASPPAARPQRRAVFVCEADGVPVYADRPCAAATDPRWLVVEQPAAGAVGSISAPAPAAAVRPRRLPARQAETPDHTTATRCDRLQHRLDQIDDSMRAGYSAREAARLWQRWRDAKEQLREARC